MLWWDKYGWKAAYIGIIAASTIMLLSIFVF